MDENFNNQNQFGNDNQNGQYTSPQDYTNQYTQPSQNYSNQYDQTQGYAPYNPQNNYSNQNTYGQNNYSNQNTPVQQYDCNNQYAQPQQYSDPYSSQYTPYNANPSDKKGMAIASMILGIVSVCICCFWYIAIFTAIIGLVLGIVSMKKNEGGRGMAIAGIITSIVAIAAIIFVIIYVFVILGTASSSIYDYYNYYY